MHPGSRNFGILSAIPKCYWFQVLLHMQSRKGNRNARSEKREQYRGLGKAKRQAAMTEHAQTEVRQEYLRKWPAIAPATLWLLIFTVFVELLFMTPMLLEFATHHVIRVDLFCPTAMASVATAFLGGTTITQKLSGAVNHV